jgi:cytochrome c-type biogenesis protein
MGLELHLGITFLAGVLSFLSPCVLPLIPSFFGFLGSKMNGALIIDTSRTSNTWLLNRWILVIHTLGFVLGFVLLFAILGLVFSGSALLLSGAQGTIQLISGVFVILFAFHTWFNLFPFLQYEKKLNLLGKTSGMFGSFLAGAAFGAGWTPCIGPILASILFFAAVSGEPLIGMVYLGVYGLGLGLPFIFMSLFFQNNSRVFDYLRTHQKQVKFLSGLLLLLMGIFILTGQTLVFASWLPTLGFQLERWVQQSPEQSKHLGLVIFGGVILIVLGIGLCQKSKRLYNRFFILSLITLLSLGIILQSIDQINLVLYLARWIQFQGI